MNLEEKRGRPARYTLGDALPDELELLPKAVSEGGVQVCNDSGERKNGEEDVIEDRNVD